MAWICPWEYHKYGYFPGSHVHAGMGLCCFLPNFKKSKSILFQHLQLLQVLHMLLLSLLHFSLEYLVLVSVDQAGSTLGFNLLQEYNYHQITLRGRRIMSRFIVGVCFFFFFFWVADEMVLLQLSLLPVM